MKNVKPILLVLISILLTFCKDNPTQVIENIPETVDNIFSSLIKIENSIDIGGEKTNFNFKVIAKSESDSNLILDRKIKWDFDSDGVFDTEWIEADTISNIFTDIGKHNITANIMLDSNKIAVCSSFVYSQPIINFSQIDTTYVVHEMCYSHDEEKIFFAWGGYPHKIYSMDKDGNNIECITCNLDSEDCRHYPSASPDGKYIAYDYKHRLNILDLETKIEKQLSTVFYSNSNIFTNDSKYCLLTNPDNREIQLIDIENGKDSLLIKSSHKIFASPIPNENKIAYYEYDTEYSYPITYSNIKLYFYDLEKKQIFKTYDDIPLVGNYQVLAGANAIYFTELHILYFLETGNSYKIDATEYRIWEYWQSAISKHGNEILFAANRGLIKFSLPTDLE